MFMSGLGCEKFSRLNPVHEKFSLCEVPGTVGLGECVEVTDGGDHKTTLTSMDGYMVR